MDPADAINHVQMNNHINSRILTPNEIAELTNGINNLISMDFTEL